LNYKLSSDTILGKEVRAPSLNVILLAGRAPYGPRLSCAVEECLTTVESPTNEQSYQFQVVWTRW